MKVSQALKRAMSRSRGKAEVVKVPQNMKPTAESLKRLECEISAQINANEAMRRRSMQSASKSYR